MRAVHVVAFQSVNFTSTAFILGVLLVLTDQGEHIVFVSLGLAYFTKYEVFQIHPFCCK